MTDVIRDNNTDDDIIERSLRPKTFDDYIGREQEKESLRILIAAAKKRGESVDHILFHGPPGLGKTSLAHIVANEMNANIRVTSGPVIDRAGDLAAILTSLEPRDILFIDEIHRLNKMIEEVLYPAMEDFAIDIVTGKGPGANSVRLTLPPFTIIGATTRAGILSAALRDRFGAIYRLDYYSVEDLYKIIHNSAYTLKIPIEDEGARLIASRSRGTARIANRLLRRVRDYVQVKYDGNITAKNALEALNLHEVDEYGLDELDRKILRTIIDYYNGGPVGIGTISAAISEDVGTIEEVYEPFLLQSGFLQRTPRGRIVTRKAYEHLGLEYNEDQLTLG